MKNARKNMRNLLIGLVLVSVSVGGSQLAGAEELPRESSTSSDPAVLIAYDPTFPIPEDPVWAAVDAGSLDVRTSSASPDTETEAQVVDYSSMWRYLNSDFGVEREVVDYSSMWRYLNSDYLAPAPAEQDPVWTVVDGGSLGAITSGEPTTSTRRERATGDQAGEMLGMIDPSIAPEDRFPG